MLLIMIKILAATFAFSSVFYGAITLIGRVPNSTFSDGVWSSFTRFHTKKSLIEHLEERYLKQALVLLKVRNYSFTAFIILSVIDYITRI